MVPCQWEQQIELNSKEEVETDFDSYLNGIVSRKCVQHTRNNRTGFYNRIPLCTASYNFRIRTLTCLATCNFISCRRHWYYSDGTARHSVFISIDSNFSNTLLDRGGEITAQSVNMAMAQDDVAESTEKMTLKRLRKKIGQHLQSGTMSDLNVVAFSTVLNPETTDVNVTGFLAG